MTEVNTDAIGHSNPNTTALAEVFLNYFLLPLSFLTTSTSKQSKIEQAISRPFNFHKKNLKSIPGKNH